MRKRKKPKKISGQWYFLIAVVLIYFILFIFKKNLFFSGLIFFNKIIIGIIPTFFFVLILMGLSNYFVTPEFIIRHFKERKIRKWFFVIVGGILSAGPIYMWYPLLNNLKSKGLNYGLIACFLYNRAIKIPLLPVAIFYFGAKYILMLGFIMILMSVIQGVIINKLME